MSQLKPSDDSSPAPRRSKRQVVPGKHAFRLHAAGRADWSRQVNVLSGSDLSASDAESAAGTLTFTISGINNGQFERVSAPGVAITTFTAFIGSPNVSAATIVMQVRVPVPRSWLPSSTSTDPSE